jgi:hypothetical protein
MENHGWLSHGSCSRERGDSFSGPMRQTPTGPGQVPGRPRESFNAKPDEVTQRMAAKIMRQQKEP